MNKSSKQPRKQNKGEKKYRVRNWREYNQALVDRGKIVFWITEEAMKAWERSRKRIKGANLGYTVTWRLRQH